MSPARSIPAFDGLIEHAEPLTDGTACEQEWLADSAVSGRPAAHLWRGESGFIVPRSYRNAPGWASTVSLAWPGNVLLRRSGGGLVPQGPGILNLSLVWQVADVTPQRTDDVYHEMCGLVAAALAGLGIRARTRAVNGSFCDGRFNLAVGERKLVGTAQAWLRVEGVPVVLCHAIILMNIDTATLVQRANAFEGALGTGRLYRADSITSIVAEVGSLADCTATVGRDDSDAILSLERRFVGGLCWALSDRRPCRIERLGLPAP